jgi:hypothetical protein
MKKLVLLVSLLTMALAACSAPAAGDGSDSTSTSVSSSPAAKDKTVGTRHDIGCTSTGPGRLARRCY